MDLGGIMFWSIDNDDFRGSCHNRPYPLIEAGKEALLGYFTYLNIINYFHTNNKIYFINYGKIHIFYLS